MGASSLCNFLSFLLPSAQNEKTPPTHFLSPLSSSLSSDSLSLPTLSYSSQSHDNRLSKDGYLPLMPKEEFSSPNNDFLSVVCPSLAYSNTLFFKSAYNVQVIVGEDEPEEALLRRFKREVFRAGVINECKRRRYFENKQEEKKRRTRDAAKRNRRRRPTWRQQPTDKQEASDEKGKAKKDEEEDNWELPTGDLPY